MGHFSGVFFNVNSNQLFKRQSSFHIKLIILTMKFVKFSFLSVAMLMLYAFADPMSEERRRGGSNVGVGNNEMQRGATEPEQTQQHPEVEKMLGEFTFDKWTLNWTGGV